MKRVAAFPAIAMLAILVSGPTGASADTVYEVSGTFGSSGPFYAGPLNGGSFSGTFTATLPATGNSETISTFDITLLDSTGAVFGSFSSSGGDLGSTGPESSCVTSPSTIGPCEEVLFSNSSFTDILQLVLPPGSTGGAIDVTSPTGDQGLGSFVAIGGFSSSTESLVASGSITAMPEAGSTLLLLTTALAGILSLSRRAGIRRRKPTSLA